MRLDTAHSSRAPAFGWLLALALVLALALGETGPAAAQAEFSVKAPQAILMDADTGAIMFQRNADELMSPASMSKLMMLAVAVQGAQGGRDQAQRRVLHERERLAQGRRALGHLGDVRAGRHEGQASRS